MTMIPQHVLNRLQTTKVLVVDDEYYSRKVIRTLLMAMGVSSIFEEPSGARGLEAIRLIVPDIVLVDWEMPNMDGAAFAKTVRAPGSFPYPNVPLIMLTGHSERWRVEEAMRTGINDYLVKPVSGKMLSERLVTNLTKPRPMVRLGSYYGPEPRPASAFKPVNDISMDDVILIN
jgi:two-component system, chemotaxis family, chemotaxis protein CheY